MTSERCLSACADTQTGLPVAIKADTPLIDHQQVLATRMPGSLVTSWRATGENARTVGISGDSMLQLKEECGSEDLISGHRSVLARSRLS